MAIEHNLWLHFGADEHPFVTYFEVHQGYIQGFDPEPCKEIQRPQLLAGSSLLTEPSTLG